MTTDAPRIQPRLSAEQALRRLLELIRTSKSISEFTPQRLEEAMGVPIQQWEKEYGFGERLTPHWTYGFVMPNPTHGFAKPDSLKRSRRQRFDFSFNPRPNTSPDMTEICRLDFEQFAAELRQMGFSRDSVYDSPPQMLDERYRLPHGGLMYDVFARPGMNVEVTPRGEGHEPIEKIGHLCVKWVWIY